MTNHINTPETQTTGKIVQIKRKRGEKKEPETAEVVLSAADGTSPERLTFLTGEVTRLNHDIMANGYQMGLYLAEVADKRLYVYGGFKDLTTYLASISISRQWAYNLIKIVKEYTEKDFLDVGVKKLQLILQAAPEDRAPLLDQARNGAPVSDLEPQVRVSNAVRKGATPEETESKPETPISVGRVTCVAREGIYAHDLVDKESEKESTIQSLSHHPCFTTVEFENGATGIFIVYVDKNTGTLKTKIVFKRRE